MQRCGIMWQAGSGFWFWSNSTDEILQAQNHSYYVLTNWLKLFKYQYFPYKNEHLLTKGKYSFQIKNITSLIFYSHILFWILNYGLDLHDQDCISMLNSLKRTKCSECFTTLTSTFELALSLCRAKHKIDVLRLACSFHLTPCTVHSPFCICFPPFLIQISHVRCTDVHQLTFDVLSYFKLFWQRCQVLKQSETKITVCLWFVNWNNSSWMDNLLIN